MRGSRAGIIPREGLPPSPPQTKIARARTPAPTFEGVLYKDRTGFSTYGSASLRLRSFASVAKIPRTASVLISIFLGNVVLGHFVGVHFPFFFVVRVLDARNGFGLEGVAFFE